MNQQTAGGKLGSFQFGWDTQTAAAVIVVGALVFLVVVRKGFGGLVVSVGN